VANDQRKVIYEQRNELMAEDDISDTIASIRADVVESVITVTSAQSLEEQWDVPGLEEALEREFALKLPVGGWLEPTEPARGNPARAYPRCETRTAYAGAKEELAGAAVHAPFREGRHAAGARRHWKEHLAAMDYLRQGIHLRGYAQKNPKQEYKREAFEMFTGMLERIKHEVVSILSKVQVRARNPTWPRSRSSAASTAPMQFQHAEASAMADAEDCRRRGAPHRCRRSRRPKAAPAVRARGRKVGRNEPCPCGSGKKVQAVSRAVPEPLSPVAGISLGMSPRAGIKKPDRRDLVVMELAAGFDLRRRYSPAMPFAPRR
jgi:preprotein translocase subunit SecA